MFLLGRVVVADEGDPFAAGLGGTEQAVIHLTEALAALGEAVCVVGGVARARRVGRVEWVAAGAAAEADVAVAVNDASLLRDGGSASVVWFHNEVELLREVRKGRLGALWRHRPAAVFIGSEQARTASRLLPFRARAVIPYGLPERVLSAAVAADVPGPRAIFTSQAYRGLAEVIAMWRREIAPNLPAARLSAFLAAGDVARFSALAEGCPGIWIGPRIGNDAVLATLRSVRVLLAPGHRSETFCMAAAEAVAMGVPVVTLGIGSLKERVRDGVDGFVCADWASMAARTRAVLENDTLWRSLHTSGLDSRIGAGWGGVAERWRAFVGDLATGRPGAA